MGGFALHLDIVAAGVHVLNTLNRCVLIVRKETGNRGLGMYLEF
jgi:hypothetical protein